MRPARPVRWTAWLQFVDPRPRPCAHRPGVLPGVPGRDSQGCCARGWVRPEASGVPQVVSPPRRIPFVPAPVPGFCWEEPMPGRQQVCDALHIVDGLLTHATLCYVALLGR